MHIKRTTRLYIIVLGFSVCSKSISYCRHIQFGIGSIRSDINVTTFNGVIRECNQIICTDIDIGLQGSTCNHDRLNILAILVVRDCSSRTRERRVGDDNFRFRQIIRTCTFTEDDAPLCTADDSETINRKALLGGDNSLSTRSFANINDKVVNRCIFLKTENRVPVTVTDSASKLESTSVTIDGYNFLELRMRSVRCIISAIPLVVNRDIGKDFNGTTACRRLECVNNRCIRRIPDLGDRFSG